MKQGKQTAFWTKAFCAAIALTILGASQVDAQQGPPRGQRSGGDGPTEAMLNACFAKQANDSCSVQRRDGETVEGRCSAPKGRHLACVPAGAGPGGAVGPPRGASNSGSEISATQAYTAGILCDNAVNVRNAHISLKSSAQWSCDRGQRVLIANGVPDHPVGQFPNPGNPNKISEQGVRFTVTTSPITYTGPGGRVKEPVMGLNGVKFDPGSGGSCKDGITHPQQCPMGPGSGGRWNIEALGQDIFDFGEDMNNAHVQPGGAYHYHGVPVSMMSTEAQAGREMAMIGWAADGFPVYARYGYPQPGVMLGELKLMLPSYRLKQTPDTGRPSSTIVPMGSFLQDWEYVEGLGDLDECNGRFGSTPQFPQGIYHYYATDAYPYIQRCVKGSIDSQPEVRRGRDQGGEDRGRGRRGERGGGRRPQ